MVKLAVGAWAGHSSHKLRKKAGEFSGLWGECVTRLGSPERKGGLRAEAGKTPG